MAGPFGPPIDIADLPPGNRLYLLASEPSSDPTMVWGTDVEFDPLRQEAARRNRAGTFLLTPVHFMVKAVERALAEHPEVNRRMLGGRIRDYEGRHVTLSTQARDGGAGVVRLENVQEMDVERIGREIWARLLDERRHVATLPDRVLGRRRYPIFRLLGPRFSRAVFQRGMRWTEKRSGSNSRVGQGPGSAILLNYLGGRGMPPMRSFVPSRLAIGQLMTTVTVGTPEERAVVRGSTIEARSMMPLNVRSDHRLVDGIQLGRFTGTLRDYLEHPERL
jgi:hypothetical protein